MNENEDTETPTSEVEVEPEQKGPIGTPIENIPLEVVRRLIRRAGGAQAAPQALIDALPDRDKARIEAAAQRRAQRQEKARAQKLIQDARRTRKLYNDLTNGFLQRGLELQQAALANRPLVSFTERRIYKGGKRDLQDCADLDFPRTDDE